MLAVSTAWNSSLNPDAGDMLSQIRTLGAEGIELSYRLSPGQLDRLAEICAAESVPVVSVHNFCPLPEQDKPKRFYCDYYRISSPDEEERQRAVELTKKTIDTASRFGAPLAVLHAGMVEMEGGYGRHLIDYFRRGRVDSGEYRKAKKTFMRQREEQKQPFLAAVNKSLEEILPYAAAAKIRVGLENRYYPAEIPTLEEALVLLRTYHPRGLVYWHDTGHAEVNERMGITSHVSFLKQLKDYTAGFHIHDLLGIDDHLAPGSGDCDYGRILPFLSRELPMVIEAHSQASSEQMARAVETIRSWFDSKAGDSTPAGAGR